MLQPVDGLFVIDLDDRWVLARLVGADDFNETTIAGRTRICSNDAVGRLLLLAHTHKAELYSHEYILLLGVSEKC